MNYTNLVNLHLFRNMKIWVVTMILNHIINKNVKNKHPLKFYD